MADGMVTFHVRTSTHGPMFNGRTRRATGDFSDEWEEECAEYALDQVRKIHTASFREPTGYYASHVRIRRDSRGPYVGDGGIIPYGPWLEGVGSRNAASRFKGYHAFRKAAAMLDRKAHSIGERLLDRRFLRRMN